MIGLSTIASLHAWVTNVGAGCVGENRMNIVPTWYKYLERGDNVAGKCTIEFTVGARDIGAILLALVEILLRLGAIVAVFFVVWGGIQYVLSQGSPDKTKEAKDTIVNALIGVVLIMFATVIVNFAGTTLLR